MRHSTEVIEHHFFRIIRMSRLALGDYRCIIFLIPEQLHQLQSGIDIVRCDGKHLLVSLADDAVRHLLQTHIGCTHLCHISRWLRHIEHLVEERHHLGGITTMGFIVLDKRTEHDHLGFQIRLRTEQYFIQHLMSQVFLLGCLVIVVERHLGIGILRFLLQYIRKHLEGFLLALMLHEPVAQHRLVNHVERMGIYQRLQFLIGSLLIVHHLVDAHLGKRILLALTLLGFQTRNGLQHHREVLLLLIQLHQDMQGIGIAMIAGIEVFVGIYRLVILLLADIMLGKILGIGLVFRSQLYCLLHIEKSERIILQLGVIHREIEVGLCGIRLYLSGMLKEVHRSRIVVGCMLPSRLQEEVFKTFAVLRTERVLHRYRLLRHVFHFYLTGHRRQSRRAYQPHDHPDSSISQTEFHDSIPFFIILLPYDHSHQLLSLSRRVLLPR